MRGIDFLVFEKPDVTLVTGTIDGERMKELHEYLRLEVRSATDPSNIESLLPLSLSNFFQVKGLPKGKHLLQLRSSLSSNTIKFESQVIEVDLEKHTQIHVGRLGYKVEDDNHKQVCLFVFLFCFSHELLTLITKDILHTLIHREVTIKFVFLFSF